MSTPLVRTIRSNAQPVAGGADLTTIACEAPWAGTVTGVTYTPTAAQAGANTNSRTLTLYNRGQDGLGTVVVAQLALVSGVNLVDNDEKAVTLSATPANLAVAASDILEWESLHVGTGIADPGGMVEVEISRS